MQLLETWVVSQEREGVQGARPAPGSVYLLGQAATTAAAHVQLLPPPPPMPMAHRLWEPDPMPEDGMDYDWCEENECWHCVICKKDITGNHLTCKGHLQNMRYYSRGTYAAGAAALAAHVQPPPVPQPQPVPPVPTPVPAAAGPAAAGAAAGAAAAAAGAAGAPPPQPVPPVLHTAAAKAAGAPPPQPVPPVPPPVPLAAAAAGAAAAATACHELADQLHLVNLEVSVLKEKISELSNTISALNLVVQQSMDVAAAAAAAAAPLASAADAAAAWTGYDSAAAAAAGAPQSSWRASSSWD